MTTRFFNFFMKKYIHYTRTHYDIIVKDVQFLTFLSKPIFLLYCTTCTFCYICLIRNMSMYEWGMNETLINKYIKVDWMITWILDWWILQVTYTVWSFGHWFRSVKRYVVHAYVWDWLTMAMCNVQVWINLLFCSVLFCYVEDFNIVMIPWDTHSDLLFSAMIIVCYVNLIVYIVSV